MNERGFVAIEWVAAVALLLFPVVVLVATAPVWVERQHAAIVAAREAARVLARDWPSVSNAAEVAQDVARDHGIDHVSVVVHSADRGENATVSVTVTMPAIAVAGMSIGAWSYTAVAERRIDDYRSR